MSMTDEQIEVIVAMYEEGASFRVIGEAIDKTADQVKHWMRLNRSVYGLEKRRPAVDRGGALSEFVMHDCPWNVRLGNQLIQKRWTEVA